MRDHHTIVEQDHHAPIALVTGAFSGIGQATALLMAQSGWTVYASGRTLAKSSDLMAQAQRAGISVQPMLLDVTDEASIAEAMARIEHERGRLDVLVNNAGLAVHGAVTEISNEQLRWQFETNTIATVATSRAALELMSRHGDGRIINISSIMGKMAFPGTGAYCASKHALEALSDTMRLEFKLIGPGYHVILIEVPVIKTKLGDNAQYAAYGNSPRSLYGNFNTLAHEFVEQIYERGVAPAVVARAVLHAATAPRPRTRYVVTAQAKVLLALRRLLPDRAFDRFVMTLTPRLKRKVAARAAEYAQHRGGTR